MKRREDKINGYYEELNSSMKRRFIVLLIMFVLSVSSIPQNLMHLNIY